MLRVAGLAPLAMLCCTVAACGGPPAPPVEAAAPPPASAEPPPPPLGLVNATVVVETCPNVTQYNARMAENAIRQLVEPCTKVPGGAAHFSATMLPSGRIQLGSPTGDPNEGVVPTCVVTNQLKHKLLLRKACTFRVQLEERTIAP